MTCGFRLLLPTRRERHLFRPVLHHHPRAVRQRDLIFGPILDCRPIRSHRHGIILDAGEVFGEAISGAVPNVDAKGKVGLGFRGQVRLDSS
jgi:hypothetical protein